MSWRRTLIKLLALFVLPCSIITTYLYFSIGNIQSFKIGPINLLDNQYTLRAAFDDVNGMLPNDNVKVAGVVVGKVKSVKVVDGRALVTFKVRKGVELATDSTAAVRWRNLLGQRYLYLYPGPASTVLRSGDRITRTRSVVDLGELFNRLGPIVKAIDPKQVNDFLDAVVGGLDGNEEKLRSALDNLAALAGTLGARDQAIGRLVENLDTVSATIASRDREIRTILDNLVLITKTFSENTDVLDNAVTNLKTFSDNFGGLLENNRLQIDRTVSNLATIVALVRQKLPVLDDTVMHLDEAARSLFGASRLGDWLDQDIYCGTIGVPPLSVEVPCQPLSSNGSNSAAHRTTGVDALRQLIGSGR
ncbi:MAG TPA: MCE family protein [Acidimicrobiales bacterium]|nr:MCE family protein [Acidimicrobiales bacterium]